MAADHSLEPLELVTYQEGTEENWFSHLLLREVRGRAWWNTHSGVPDSEPGPDSLYSNQFPGDADTAGVGTSFEELLDESTLPWSKHNASLGQICKMHTKRRTGRQHQLGGEAEHQGLCSYAIVLDVHQVLRMSQTPGSIKQVILEPLPCHVPEALEWCHLIDIFIPI